MTGAKRPRLMPKRKKWSARATGKKRNFAEPEQNSVGSKDAKEPVLGGGRKRERSTESSSVELSGSSEKKRAKVAPSAEQQPAAVKTTSGHSKNAEATFDHDITEETRLSFPDGSSVPEDPEVDPSHPPSVPTTELKAESSPEPGDEAGFQDSTPLSDSVQESPDSTSLDGIETSLAEDLNVPHTERWISFGYLECLEDPSICYDLRIQNNGSESLDILIGSDPECDFMVEGDDIGEFHCRITLNLNQRAQGPVHRRVVIISSPSLCTTVWVENQMFVVDDKMVLLTGNVIRLGNGDHYIYHGPKLSDLYAEESLICDRVDANSSVTQVQRLCDKSDFVAKKISHRHIKMARTEISVYEILGPHPRIVQFIESFYDFESGIHHLILEVGFMDLHEFTLDMRLTGQDVLQVQAAKWTRQITEGIAHMHRHGITHRDLKPQNILVFLDEPDRVDMKIMDMGLAKQNTIPLTERWFVGTPQWYAPGPFMAYKDDKYVDCYAIGRVLFFLLTPYKWPEETEEPDKSCACEEECQAECAKREAAFGVVKDLEVGARCLDFLKKVLVGVPQECSKTSVMLRHPYLVYGPGVQK